MTGTSHEENHESHPAQNDSDHDIYTDPALVSTNVNDPLLQFLQVWWRHIAVGLVACGIVIYFVSAFRETYISSMKSSADVMNQIQREYRSFLEVRDEISTAESEVAAAKDELAKAAGAKNNDKAKQESEKKVSDAEKKLTDAKARSEEIQSSMLQIIGSTSTAKEPYKSLAQVYRVLVARAAGSKDGAVEIEPALQVPFLDWEKSGAAGSEARFASELGALALGRGLLDSASEAQKGREILEGLARRGTYSNVSAAMALSTIAKTPEEVSKAVSILEDIQKRYPEQGDILGDEIKRLQAKLAK